MELLLTTASDRNASAPANTEAKAFTVVYFLAGAGYFHPPRHHPFCKLLRRVSIEHSDIERSLLHDPRESELPEQRIRCCSEGLRIAGSSPDLLPASLCAFGEFAKFFSQRHTAKVEDAAKSHSSSTIPRSLEHMP